MLRLTVRSVLPVAPFTGAWIETYRQGPTRRFHRESRPSRARGLKRERAGLVTGEPRVAPFTGAWIETIRSTTGQSETSGSRPSRARGLKPDELALDVPALPSRPSRARGLKLLRRCSRIAARSSRPSRARGLKRGAPARVSRFVGRALHGRVD